MPRRYFQRVPTLILQGGRSPGCRPPAGVVSIDAALAMPANATAYARSGIRGPRLRDSSLIFVDPVVALQIATPAP